MGFQYSNFDVIVSLDFGYSFSGTCYALTGNLSPKELREQPYPSIIHVTNWPKQDNLQHKTPTINVYDQNFHLLHWGMSAVNIKTDQPKEGNWVMEQFKFNLPTSIAQTGAFYTTGNTTNYQLLCMRATIDYFREIIDWTVCSIQNTKTVYERKVEKKDIRFIITIPGHWSASQRRLMRVIAIEAGMISEDDHEKRVIFISESLATLIYCERNPDIVKSNHRENETGYTSKKDKYMILDVADQIARITIYESTMQRDKKDDYTFSRCQLLTVSGYRCGSAYLDLKMMEILLEICFGAEKEYWYDNKPKIMELESLMTPLMYQFSMHKTSFGTASKEFIPDCCRETLEMYSDSDGNSNSDCLDAEYPVCNVCNFNDGHDEKFVERDHFGDDTVFSITQGKVLDQLKLRKDLDGVIITAEGVTVECDDNYCEIRLTYKYMRENVFDGVINNIVEFITRQIKKIDGNITATYMAGRYGGLPYMNKRILNEFPIDSPLSLGHLIQDNMYDTAAMRGALFHGIDASRKEPQSSIVVSKYEDHYTSQYNTLVCLDIGYNGTVCSYRDLRLNSDDMTEITDWPGLKEENSIIPTAKETLDGKTLWGAQIGKTNIFKPESFVTPSKLMSAVNGIFKTYLIGFLEPVFKHVHNVIARTNPELSDKSKYRYVITMENCYPFFKVKSEMRLIAQVAGIINKGDPVKRLLLIRRENAAAMYFEKTVFTAKKADSNRFLHINIYHDTCHLSLHESTNLTSYETPDDNNTLPTFTPYSVRNVRCTRSATFQFNFVSKLVANLSVFISNSVCCKDQKSHDTSNQAYNLGLTCEFLEYLKNKLDFSRAEAQTIQVTELPGCHISITKYEVLEYVFWPAIRELTSAVKRNGMQHDVFRLFNIDKIDKIFLSGVLIEAKKETCDFLEKIVVKNLSEVMNVKQGIISSSEASNKEALLGAAHYGNHPESFTERISRRSYAIQVCGYNRQEFDDYTKRNISYIKKKNEKTMKDDIYLMEASSAYIDKRKRVCLFYHSSCNPFNSKNEKSKRTPDDIISLISRGSKISEHNQMHGITKRFYAVEECIVYVTIYSSEDPISSKNETKIDLKNFIKIHQFELYMKLDEDDPTTAFPNSRLHFDVRLKPDKDDFRFEAFVCSKLGEQAPEFVLPDEFLVTNVYDDD